MIDRTERSYPITRGDKHNLALDVPVMNAAGILGFGDEYAGLIDLSKLGAFVTNPVSLAPRAPASGTRVVTLDHGLLVHTGLPNPGLNKICLTQRNTWERLGIPVIVHIIAGTPEDVRRCLARLEEEDIVAGVEIGLPDDASAGEAAALVRVAADRAEKPLIARLPFGAGIEYAQAVSDAGAGGLVVSAPPRGTARDGAGRLVGGRLYSPTIHPIILRQVGQMTRVIDVPVVAAGGIRTPQDARDYLQAGAAAVQIDLVAWLDPASVTWIARDLRGSTVTQPVDPLLADWHPRLSETERALHTLNQTTQSERQRLE
ncbi:MAG: hypothetical protein NZM00_08780 [Anaerolinea sp.]|nr:hypothetical protein [Anaerolinea sp.]